MARQRGAVAGGYRCGICRERGHNSTRCTRPETDRPQRRRAEVRGPIGQRPALAPLVYVILSLELKLQDRPHGRAFVVTRGWLNVLLRAARKSAA